MITTQKKEAYTKTWTSSGDFPTYESDESQVRADMQYLYEEIRVWVNAILDALAAAELPFTATAGIPEDDIQSAIQNLKNQLDSAVITGLVPDDSITAVKLKSNSVTEPKIAAGAVTEAKIADGAVTEDKIEDQAITGNKLRSYSVKTAKLDNQCVTADKIRQACITKEHFCQALRDELGI